MGEVAGRANVTINDVFLAICAGGLRRYLKEMGALPKGGLVAHIADPVQRIRAIHRSSTVAEESLSGFSKPVAENYGAQFRTPFRDRERLPHLQCLAVYTGEAVGELETALAGAPVRRRRSHDKPTS